MPAIKFEKPDLKSLIIYPILGLLTLYFGPDLLTGFSDPNVKAPFNPVDYLRSLQIIISIVLLWFVGMTMSILAQRFFDIPLQDNPIVTVFAGLIVLFLYVYIRSLVNTFLGIPLTPLELIFVAVCAIVFCVIQPVKLGLHLKPYNLFSAYLLFLVFVALAHMELPRSIMLSSDPDQHAFFATQITKLGGVPYSQAHWGGLSFGYPAGTGVLVFIFSSLTQLTLSDTTTIMPSVLAYLSIWLLCETAFKDQREDTRTYALIVCALIYFYALLYGFEQGHFHLEGYGRMASLWVLALPVHYIFQSRNRKHTALESNYWLALILGLLFVATTLNPVNLFFPATLFGVVFITQHPRRCWKLGIFALLLPLLMLDPYFFDFVFSSTRTGGVELLVENNSASPSMPFDPALILSKISEVANHPLNFFSFQYLPTTYLPVLCSLIALCLLTDTPENAVGKKSMLIFLLGLLTWILFSGIFASVEQVTALRLLAPYFQYSKFQFIYCMTFLLIAFLAIRFFSLSKSHLSSSLAVLLIGYSLSIVQKNDQSVVKRPRVDYCGSMGCFTQDDEYIAKILEETYEDFKLRDGQPMPRILVPNAVSIHGIEKWLMPRGGVRSLPFHDTFPLAYFYYQGDSAYTFENYDQYICRDFNIDWLRQHNIQYLFTPTNMMDACIFGYNTLGERFSLIAESGTSRLYKLYE